MPGPNAKETRRQAIERKARDREWQKSRGEIEDIICAAIARDRQLKWQKKQAEMSR